MKKTILLLSLTALLCGCTNTRSTVIVDASGTTAAPAPAKAESYIVVVDNEAAALGFPEKFISKEQDTIDWSKADAATVSGMDVEIYDTGTTVEVCGGLGCDK